MRILNSGNVVIVNTLFCELGACLRASNPKKLRRLDDTNFQISVSPNMNKDPPPEKKTETGSSCSTRSLDPELHETNTCVLTFKDEARVGYGLVLCFPNVIDVVQDGAVEEIEAQPHVSIWSGT
jgi:hypothetical protein